MTFIFLEMVEYIDNSDHGKCHLLTCLPPDVVQITSLFGKKIKDKLYYSYDSGLLYRTNHSSRTKKDFPYQTITGRYISVGKSRYSVVDAIKEILYNRY